MSLESANQDLRAALLALKPTGPKGFEGLVALILETLTGQTFRLASSGRQDGKDGQGAHVAFETKLYKTKINKNEVLSKITSIIGSVSPPDLWVLGATVGADTQLIDQIRAATAKTGIAVEVWDWPASDRRPLLAVACAASATAVAGFLDTHLADKALSRAASNALAIIAASEGFATVKAALLETVTDPSLAGPFARAANQKWLRTAFADRRRARSAFGQPLAPSAQGAMETRDRPSLVAALAPAFVTAPTGRLYAVLGGEGVGKSWLVAQTWLGLANPPIMLFLSATELQFNTTGAAISALLLDQMFAQTSTRAQDHLRARWEERFASWRRAPSPASPRFVLCVDGLNQNPDFDWTRWLVSAASALSELGGVLVVTARQIYFDAELHTALSGLVDTVQVPAWTPADLADIAKAKGFRTDSLAQDVSERLRNPRLLSVALELHEAGSIRDLDELTVERLLFEHIRANARDGVAPEPASQFVHRLSRHARDILDRTKADAGDDRLVFETRFGTMGHELSASLLAVLGEHFYQPLPNDPSRYTLTNDGLALALGLAMITALQTAERNGRSVADQLDAILEPIAALDKTAEATFAAVMAAVGDAACSPAIRRALINGFLGLQNIDATRFPAFRALIRDQTDVAMEALAALSVSARYYAQGDWLVSALRGQRGDPESWATIGRHLERWLRTYSLAPSLSVSTPPQEGEKYVQAVETKRQALEDAWDELGESERGFFTAKMTRDDSVNPGVLHEIAFWLLAGMPLADFAEALVASALSEALNSALVSPYDDFTALLGFNQRDWPQARSALLAAAEFLQGAGVSSTGGWARVAVLRGLATSADAAEETALVNALTEGRQTMKGWRRLDTYCANDPCDPESAEPSNVAHTAEQYAAIDVDALAQQRWMGADDHFMRDALPGVVRFRPQAALALHRRYAASVANRDGSGHMAALSGVAQNSAALDRPAIEALLALGRRLSTPSLGTPETNDAWVASQYAIFAALPHLDGDTQLGYLMTLPSPGSLMLKTTAVFSPANAGLLEEALETASRSDDQYRKLGALAFARHSGTRLTARSRGHVSELSKDASSFVRAEALGILEESDDVPLLQAVIDRPWRADQLNGRTDAFEIDQGSAVLVKAMSLGLLDVKDGLERIGPSQFSRATRLVGAPAVAIIVDRLRKALSKAIAFDPPFKPPAVEREVAPDDAAYPSLLALADRRADGKRPLEHLSETPEDFLQRQKDGWTAFDRYEASASHADAGLIIDDVGPSTIAACVAFAPDWGRELATVLCGVSEPRLSQIRNFGLILATALPPEDADLARALFDRLEQGASVVSLTYGPAKTPHEAVMLWRARDDETWDRVRTTRLDAATNDAELAQEVLAALLAGKADVLRTYVESRLVRPEPVAAARALMVLGLGGASEFAEQTLRQYRAQPGLLGRAAKAAHDAYLRDRWAQHWFTEMRAALEPTAFWRCSILFLRIVDGRFSVWAAESPNAASDLRGFEPGLQDGIERRIKSWRSKRLQVLFGHKTRETIAAWSRPDTNA